MDKLDFVTREDAVVDGVMANGLVDNGQPDLALAYVLQVVEARAQEQVRDCMRWILNTSYCAAVLR